MTSDLPLAPGALYVWAWLPGEREPRPAGILERVERPGGGVVHTFAYGQGWLRAGHPAVFLPELPTGRGRQEPGPGLAVHGVLRDAGPDAWGQRVIMRRLLARDVRDRDSAELSLLTHLLHSGSDRVGALDFQLDPRTHVPRHHDASLEDLLEAADRLQAGDSLLGPLGDALEAGSSVGGARPKATLRDGERSLIAKFSAPTDVYPVMRAEAVAMELARRAGCDVAPTELVEVAGRDVLLVERFDRGPGGTRRQFVSALTLLGLDEMAARHATYPDLADVLRTRAPARTATLHELFRRIVVNVLVGNTDDHARNHAAFYDVHDTTLRLTPAYDVCPQLRTGGEAAQAMAIGPGDRRLANLITCIDAAEVYELSRAAATAIVEDVLDTLVTHWHEAADLARLTTAQRGALWGAQVANRFATDGWCDPLAQPPR